MKNTLIRIACLLIALLMLSASFAACKKDKNNNDGESSSSEVVGSVTESDIESDTETETEDVTDTEADTDTETEIETETETENETEAETEKSKYDVEDSIGEMDLGGRRVVIAQPDMEDYINEIKVDRMTGDIVNDAIFKRNKEVERRLHITVENQVVTHENEGVVYDVLADLEAGILGGAVTYDFITNPSYATCNWITRGYFHDLKEVSNISLDNVYWAQYLNEAYEIGGKQYVASGAISLSFYKFVFATLVNKDLLESTKDETPDLIKVVQDGDWTLEYQKNLAAKYYTDLGAPGKDMEDDVFGLLTDTGISVDPYVASAEISFLKKDPTGFYTWEFDLAHASNVMDDVIELITSDATFCSGGYDTDAVSEKFASGEALMITTRFFELEEPTIKEMKDEYMILPIPRYSKDQQDYYSLISDRFTAVALPISVEDDDVENIGAVIELMAAESYRKVAPQYYESVLRLRYADSPDAWEIMDGIINNVKMDAVLPYTAALTFTSDIRGYTKNDETVIKLWRWTAAQALKDGNSVMASTFNPDIGVKVNERLNGADGLQTYVKAELAKQ